ncbi:DUF3221 domain-containing protein [Bacillus sp. FJAT-28004]|uniref:DUF3221 domain-containing protein n=1 Tax=Bacillus sp. FJAT-28004 TaxID=1679165 RepID=UPI0006B6916B|nr:DUF3221 domain-containing protein [Bacillus sp. FJAT-28004]
MKNLFFLVIMLTFFSGCSVNSVNEDDSKKNWDYKEGFVVSKEDSKILVVQNSNITELKQKSIEEILDIVQPNAIWVTAEKEADLDVIEVGDQVSIKIDGGVDQSYPAQTSARKITKINKDK